ncbi:MAG: hypothetical protein FJ390_06415 [Verrucomicrobia bacterium]|nr:hypothetical protein [Verrucomicrobiota bacterium]
MITKREILLSVIHSKKLHRRSEEFTTKSTNAANAATQRTQNKIFYKKILK